jgi:16S rRNA pseudouridine516 synthase
MSKPISIIKILQSQGFGTRRECEMLIGAEAVRWGGALVEYIDDAFAPEEGAAFTVRGEAHQYHAKAYVLMHKPAGYECSQKPKEHASVYSLLPATLRQRGDTGARAGVQCVGRLDQDTTGLLLLSDDGQFIHRYTSPKKHVGKVYHVTTKHAVNDALLTALKDGVVLRDAMGDTPEPVRATDVAQLSDHVVSMTISEGRYHQVKRMIAAAGNRAEALHRVAVGSYTLPDDLPVGQWRWVECL